MTAGKKALVVVADGSEEMEAVIVIDVLRRAHVDVTVAGLKGSHSVTCSRKVKLVPDVGFNDIQDKTAFDVIVLPGGMGGAESFAKDTKLHQVLEQYSQHPTKYVGAICAAPIALEAANLFKGKKITSHPSVKDRLKGYVYHSDERVVVDGHLVTSQGPGTAFEFALRLVDLLCGSEARRTVEGPMLLKL
ncbi:DJ-1-like protein [Paraphysoderma sedebokerense]|nr:DJ-1-like protein [Paraphysoderma sedebokerense]